MYSVCAFVFVYIFVCVCTHGCAFVWRTEVNVGCFSQLPSTLFFCGRLSLIG